MLIKLLPENEFGAEILESLDTPSFLLDDLLCVTAMNTEAVMQLGEIREGMNISQFLSDSAAESIALMVSQELCTVDFSVKGTKRSATVLCGNGCRLFVLGAELGLEEDVFKNLGELSGYDMELLGYKGKPETAFEFAMRLRAEQYFPRRLPFFSAASVLSALQKELNTVLPDICARINFKYIDREGYARGSERDFALIAVSLVTSFTEQSENGMVDITVACDKDKLVLQVFNSSVQAGGNGELHFRTDHLKLLAEGNMWELVQNENGGFSLLMPFVKGGEEFLVRDISTEFLRELIAVAFCGK